MKNTQVNTYAVPLSTELHNSSSKLGSVLYKLINIIIIYMAHYNMINHVYKI